jgi:hypothetical protein
VELLNSFTISFEESQKFIFTKDTELAVTTTNT